MRLTLCCAGFAGSLLITGCTAKGPNPADPYESFNRKTFAFNDKLDAYVLKPTAKVYKAVLPGAVRKGVNNFFNNIDMLPSVANDLLQGEGKWAIKDSWRFVINSTIGIGGVLDAAQNCGLPAHYNDLGMTFAKWGDKNSPYLVLPLLGPSTIRDGSGMVFQFLLWSPYVYINDDAVAYGLAGLRIVDLRSQFLDSEGLMAEALDKYSFIRDAYLQHRNYQIMNEKNDGTDYVDEGQAVSPASPTDSAPSDYVEE